MSGLAAVFLLTLGLGQLAASAGRLVGLSLTGHRRGAGYGLGGGLLLLGALLLCATGPTWWLLAWTPLAGAATLLVQLWGASLVGRAPAPDAALFAANHPAHGACRRVAIPDGAHPMPGLWLEPPAGRPRLPALAVIVPGAGDTKTFFKWRLVEQLLAEGLAVLTIDPPGHGEYRARPYAFPDCLSAVGAAVAFGRAQPGIERVGVIGISLGGALALRALAAPGPAVAVEALAVVATPLRIDGGRAIFYREVWQTMFRAPSLGLLQAMTARQAWQTWKQGGYVSRHSTGQLFELLHPLEQARRLNGRLPLLLAYSRRDTVAPPAHAAAMRAAAPAADYLESTKASHVMLTLIPEINRSLAAWLRRQLSSTSGRRA